MFDKIGWPVQSCTLRGLHQMQSVDELGNGWKHGKDG